MIPQHQPSPVPAPRPAARTPWTHSTRPATRYAGLVLWVATLKSGIHPTIAGVAMGLLTDVHPLRRADVERAASITRLFRRSPGAASGRAAVLEIGAAVSPNERFQAAIHPWTSYLVIPIFALANAGIPLGDGVLSRALTSPVTIGVVAGLVLGKLLGISVSSLLAVRLGVGPLPRGMARGHALGAAGLAGIGFTVSLFVAELAFTDEALRNEAKIGVLVASVLAAALGLALLARRGVDPVADRVLPLSPAVDPAHDRVLGSPDAPRTLVVYGDYACPHTRALARELDVVGERMGDALRIVPRQLPNEDAHPGTTLASEAAVAAAAQNRFAPMHRRLLSHPAGDDLGPADLLDAGRDAGLDVDRLADDLRHHVRGPAVQADVEGAARSGVTGTPTIFLDGERLDEGYDAASLLARLARPAAAQPTR